MEAWKAVLQDLQSLQGWQTLLLLRDLHLL
jgi:hypothetical protein